MSQSLFMSSLYDCSSCFSNMGEKWTRGQRNYNLFLLNGFFSPSTCFLLHPPSFSGPISFSLTVYLSLSFALLFSSRWRCASSLDSGVKAHGFSQKSLSSSSEFEFWFWWHSRFGNWFLFSLVLWELKQTCTSNYATNTNNHYRHRLSHHLYTYTGKSFGHLALSHLEPTILLHWQCVVLVSRSINSVTLSP